MPKLLLSLATALLIACSAAPSARTQAQAPAHASRRMIVFVWDGMRPDSISETDTPHLAALAKRGTFFADNHSS